MSIRPRLNFVQKHQVAKLLEQVCHRDADGFAVYADHHYDLTIAAEISSDVGFEVKATLVASLRAKLIGNIRPAEGKARSTKALAIAEMVAAIEALETAASVHQATVTTIIETQDILREEIAGLRAAVSIAGTEIKNIRRVGV